MNFTEKAAIVRTTVKYTNNSINNTDVYNELILEALNGISPTGENTNSLSITFATAGSGSTSEGSVSVSFITSSDFVGTIQASTIPASTTINLSAENGATLQPIAYTVTTETLTILFLNRP
jgi:hypothetical protein